MSDEQERVTDLHSLLNVLNVIVGELSLVGSLLPQVEAQFSPTQSKLEQLSQQLLSGEGTKQAILELDGLCAPILSMLYSLQLKCTEAERGELVQSRDNLMSVFRILKQRVIEFEDFDRGSIQWTCISTEVFSSRIVDVFRAIEKNARGRYGICFEPARCADRDYYVDLKIESELGTEIYMPHRLQDVVRDLAANARKYTEPGGSITIRIHQCRDELRCSIEDTGMGIPEDEIARVVEFGYRASNVAQIKSYGGGLGLTKAAWFVHRWQGTLRIASKLGQGTRIQFTVPNAADRVARR